MEMNAILNAAINFSNNNPPQEVLQFDLDILEDVEQAEVFNAVPPPPAIQPVLGPSLTLLDAAPLEPDTIQEIFRENPNPSVSYRYFIYTDNHLRRVLVTTTQEQVILNVNWYN